MEKIQLKLKNCYGIKKLEKEFDFSGDNTSHHNTYAIYAPNGVMKTSFAKTFQDLSFGSNSEDIVFPERETIREIKKEDGSDLVKEEIFVIEAYNEAFTSEKMSTLLVNKELKNKYDKIYLGIDEEKERLLRELKNLSGLRNNIEKEISKTFTSEDNRLFDSLGRVEKEVMDYSEPIYSEISYKEIFNEKVLNFLNTKDFKEKIKRYIEKYDELIIDSKYFKKGVFNHNNASAIAKSLMDNGFFEAKHSVSLNTKESKNEIHTKEELEKVIDEEKTAILTNPDLVKVFDELDGKLKANKELRDFRDYLLNNLKILPELKNLDNFRQKLWVSYFKSQKSLYENFLKVYNDGKSGLDKIIEQAKIEETQWRSVIDIFNKRFFVPFMLTMRNQDDVILKRDVPSIGFVFKDSISETSIEKSELLQVLSNGEKRALYILNIIFEVRARKDGNLETLFIVDDIADSFDYKNKYAIIEYLKDISEETNFKQIILTHNFDFFRTVQSRFVPYDNCLMVEKTAEEIKITKAEYIKNPFKHWMEHLDDDKKLIASIPFVRNLIEYTKGDADPDYLKLTSLLHAKSDSDSVLKSDLKNIYRNVFPNLKSTKLILTNESENITELIFNISDACLIAPESINLENKVVLAIAIRLRAEKFMLDKINGKSEAAENQTRKLFERFKVKFRTEQENIKILERVILMTPENIHFNSFMYEPILDMSDEHLKTLYCDIKKLK
ncbi:MAG: hypothetical protein EVJ46_07480 [Candidatus Acididesulfobacter guangdongensis]|uniref:Phage infection protein n=1 Tax=Acididesulfobacter guangdongensis TaxID=2597225 RepID=A0A519BFI4_ACIG2|nr:MAG: hypothetical protein EVJ46_07480 [Candidatus Acididesulfobacter guangdongensis]